MKIDDLTIGQAKELAALLGGNSGGQTNPCPGPFEIGKPYLIRTVTMIQTGRLVAVYPTEIVLEDAAWIADTGRFSDALKTCSYSEVEPFPDGTVIVGRQSIIDAVVVERIERSKK